MTAARFVPVELVNVSFCVACGAAHPRLEWHPFPDGVRIRVNGYSADGSIVCPSRRVVVYTREPGEFVQ